MSLYGMMRTGVSGMAAQASRLATIADNIANSSTNGYKRVSNEFFSRVIDSNTGSYISGAVGSNIRSEIGRQGALRASTSPTDLAISGDGFFVVQDITGASYLTRAGSYLVDNEGNLVNAAGDFLMGYSVDANGVTRIANGFGGLENINVGLDILQATATNVGEFITNLPADATVVAPADLPSANGAAPEYSGKTSIVVYDSLGNERVIDLYFAKTAANEWEVTSYDAAGATNGGFPYASGPISTDSLTFDPTTGYIVGGGAPILNIAIPGGETLDLSLDGISQLGAEYTVLKIEVNGNAPAAVDRIEIDSDGIVYGIYQNGISRPIYQLALASVPSPDNLRVLTGNKFSVTIESGDVLIGNANVDGNGAVISGALEESNADLATELTIMIESQRNYTANSKVFQTGSDLMDVLINLKR